nr:hypothetical protein [Tanacetum cinerariifolium]
FARSTMAALSSISSPMKWQSPPQRKTYVMAEELVTKLGEGHEERLHLIHADEQICKVINLFKYYNGRCPISIKI